MLIILARTDSPFSYLLKNIKSKLGDLPLQVLALKAFNSPYTKFRALPFTALPEDQGEKNGD